MTRVRTDITPHRNIVDSIVPPDNAVDKLDEALGPAPQYVEDASHVPCWVYWSARAHLPIGTGLTFQMPIQRNRYQDERNERERCEKRLVRWPRDTHYDWSEGNAVEARGSSARKSRVCDGRGRDDDTAPWISA